MDLVRPTHAADQLERVVRRKFSQFELRRDRVDRIDHIVHIARILIKEALHLLLTQEAEYLLDLRLGVDILDHRLHHIHLALAERGIERDGLAIDIALLHHIAVEDRQLAHTPARKRLDTIRSHSTDAEHEHVRIHDRAQGIFAPQGLELLIASR